jgi:hypothetical protein
MLRFLIAFVLLLATAAPAVAAEPEHVIFRVGGTTAAAELAESCHDDGSYSRCRAWLVTAVDDRSTHSPGDPATRRDEICLYAETWWWLPDGEPAAVVAEAGCVTSDTVEVEARTLAWASVRPSTVPLELVSCAPSPGHEALCDLPATRSVALSADLTGVGDLSVTRSHWRGEVPFAPHCIELDIDATRSRGAAGTVAVDGSSLVAGNASMSDGDHFVKLTCR